MPSRLLAMKQANEELLAAANANVELLTQAVAEAELIARQASEPSHKVNPARIAGGGGSGARGAEQEDELLQCFSGSGASCLPEREGSATVRRQLVIEGEQEGTCQESLQGGSQLLTPTQRSEELWARVESERARITSLARNLPLRCSEVPAAGGSGAATGAASPHGPQVVAGATEDSIECSRLRGQLRESELRAEEQRRLWNEERECLLRELREARAAAETASAAAAAATAQALEVRKEQGRSWEEMMAKSAPLAHGLLPTFGSGGITAKPGHIQPGGGGGAIARQEHILPGGGGGDVAAGEKGDRGSLAPLEPELERLKGSLRAAVDAIARRDSHPAGQVKAQDPAPSGVGDGELSWRLAGASPTLVEKLGLAVHGKTWGPLAVPGPMAEVPQTTELGGGGSREEQDAIGAGTDVAGVGTKGRGLEAPWGTMTVAGPKEAAMAAAAPGEAVSLVKSELEKLRAWYQSRPVTGVN
mmetsp:Transcript_10168/g.23463  ORF Transcript_10168/g.23463 Transcript_10168/m.23463 type:complete len:476 (-) Transcript_10168:9-1436(-)